MKILSVNSYITQNHVCTFTSRKKHNDKHYKTPEQMRSDRNNYKQVYDLPDETRDSDPNPIIHYYPKNEPTRDRNREWLMGDNPDD